MKQWRLNAYKRISTDTLKLQDKIWPYLMNDHFLMTDKISTKYNID